LEFETKTIQVRGMSCSACVDAVTRALQSIPGVTKVHVDLKAENATVTFDPFHAAESDFRDAIQEEGYETP
jgi:copper ion binding protein